jgi:hypothetical protein
LITRLPHRSNAAHDHIDIRLSPEQTGPARHLRLWGQITAPGTAAEKLEPLSGLTRLQQPLASLTRLEQLELAMDALYSRDAATREQRFAPDSPLEGTGFELPVPRCALIVNSAALVAPPHSAVAAAP